MPRYSVREELWEQHAFTYTVEARSLTEAKRRVRNGEVEADDNDWPGGMRLGKIEAWPITPHEKDSNSQ